MIVVIFGPSGVGKGTLINRLLERRNDIRLSVSCTTRARREGEVAGQHYYFLSRGEFEDKISRSGFLEWAEYAGNYYGTPLPDADALGSDRIMLYEIERQGAEQMRRHFGGGATLVMIEPPDQSVLEARLRGRGHDSEDAICRRLAIADEELKLGRTLADHVVVNRDVETAVDELAAILEKMALSSRP